MFFKLLIFSLTNSIVGSKKENSIELIKKRKDSKKEALERMKKELN